MMKKTLTTALVLFFLLMPLITTGAETDTISADQIKALGMGRVTGSPAAPNLVLKTLDGKELSLAGLRGKTVLLNFWATWCPPCREEMPTLETLYQTYKDNKKFVFLSVDSAEPKATVSDFLAKNPYHFPVLLDTDGAMGYEWGVTAIPTTYLIDPQGRVVAGVRGAFDWSSPTFTAGLKALVGK
jgi:thiol-disulfide isomerase/thioredoxin